jgi:hypothetical protein
MVLRNTDGVKARLRARTKRQKDAVLKASADNMRDDRNLARDLCPKDTTYMVRHLRAEPTREGFNYFIGFLRGDFVGQENTLVDPHRLITEFYPEFVIRGTRFQAGNDFLAEVRRVNQATRRARYKAALRA